MNSYFSFRAMQKPIATNKIGIVGEPGSGKSTLLTMLKRELIEKGHFVVLLQLDKMNIKKKVTLCGLASLCEKLPEEKFKKVLNDDSSKIVWLIDGIESLDLDEDFELTKKERKNIDTKESREVVSWVRLLLSDAVGGKCLKFVALRHSTLLTVGEVFAPKVSVHLVGFDEVSQKLVGKGVSKDRFKEFKSTFKIKSGSVNKLTHNPFVFAKIMSDPNLGDFLRPETNECLLFNKIYSLIETSEKPLKKQKSSKKDPMKFKKKTSERFDKLMCKAFRHNRKYVTLEEFRSDGRFGKVQLADFEKVSRVRFSVPDRDDIVKGELPLSFDFKEGSVKIYSTVQV